MTDDVTNDPGKWTMSPLQVLVRARDRVEVGTHPTALDAVWRDSAKDVHTGSPLTRAWGILLRSFYPAGMPCTPENQEAAYQKYMAISDFGEKPNQAGEVKALEQAITYAKTAPQRVREILARGKAVTAGQIVAETGLPWDLTDDALLSFGVNLVRIPTSPECFVLREFLAS